MDKGLDELIELLADVEHKRWASWQKHLHSKCRADSYGNLVIPFEYVASLERQINTDYKDLTEREKQYDRDEVLKTLEAMNNSGKFKIVRTQRRGRNDKSGTCNM